MTEHFVYDPIWPVVSLYRYLYLVSIIIIINIIKDIYIAQDR